MKWAFVPLYTLFVSIITIFMTAATFSLAGYDAVTPQQILESLKWVFLMFMVMLLATMVVFGGDE